MSGTTDAFCWVKAVLHSPPSAAESSLSADAFQALDHPALQGLRLRQQGVVVEPLSTPPAPRTVAAAQADSGGLVIFGGKVDPPPSPDEMPRVPASSGSAAEANAQGLAASSDSLATSTTVPLEPIPGYWQNVSYAPADGQDDRAPVVILVFQPVDGPRERAVLWRDANPGWFSDAAAVSLLNHTN